MSRRLSDDCVIIAGGGIGGLAAALTLHQIGVHSVVFEAVREMRPLGVGINLQPNAVRELYDLGITEADLDRIGLPAKEWALVGLNGNDIYSEPRGKRAGYNWPQYAVHRGLLHMLLHDKVVERLGPQSVRLEAASPAIAGMPTAASARSVEHADGSTSEPRGALLIGADGIHSAVRAQMHPGQPPIHWGGAVMWRGTTWGKPIRTGSSFVGLGTHRHRIVFYPISHPDPNTGLSMINWIAEVTMDNAEGWKQSGWFRQVPTSDFVHLFDNWIWDWLDVPTAAARRRQCVRKPDDRPRPGADLARWPGGCPLAMPRTRCIRPAPTAAARRSSIPACWAPAWSSTALIRRRLQPTTPNCAARFRSSFYATAALVRSGSSTWSTSVAAARSTPSTT